MAKFEWKVEGVQVRDNEHIKNETKSRILNEVAVLFDQAWIQRPQGDVTYTVQVDADDNNDSIVEKVVNKAKDTARAGLQAITPDQSVADKKVKK